MCGGIHEKSRGRQVLSITIFFLEAFMSTKIGKKGVAETQTEQDVGSPGRQIVRQTLKSERRLSGSEVFGGSPGVLHESIRSDGGACPTFDAGGGSWAWERFR